jgi:hypothetical protein
MRILRGLSSRCLPCGCLAGVYETYDGVIVTIIDAKGTECNDGSHRDGKIVPAGSPGSSSHDDRLPHVNPARGGD